MPDVELNNRKNDEFLTIFEKYRQRNKLFFINLWQFNSLSLSNTWAMNGNKMAN